MFIALVLCNIVCTQCYKTNSQINVSKQQLDDFDKLYLLSQGRCSSSRYPAVHPTLLRKIKANQMKSAWGRGYQCNKLKW